MTRVLLIHDTCLLRTALAAWIGREPELEVSSASWKGAVATSRALRPDVCVADMDSPDAGAGWEDARGPAGERCTGGDPWGAMLALATAGRPGPLRRAYEMGALGYLSKNASPDRLVEGIRRVAKGERYIDETLGFGFLEAAEIPLTRRELSVLSLAAGGASVGEIARSLHLSNGTVRNYMAAITRKTGARNRVDAIRISQCAGWV
ncbi:response regulator transcription factor [Streptomyces triculaminicus]|uniref:Response regulator transcription factor n=2 Tax=Streptomyces TaxID=1883 RepID=A0A939JUH6_9ACTN|nr:MULTISPECIES: response regulator transcription factor [Streptomyces]MBO0656774.1 response regulator transcription factor [Streptomyces triculaminicus]QSY47789.1 response regulator transcription factor [Streptomyces griseocarneus]